MSMLNVMEISSAGLNVQQARLEVAASNLANANTTRNSDGALYQPLSVVLESKAITSGMMLSKPVVAGVVPSTNAKQRKVYEPGHPAADAQGFVAMPGVDVLSTMLDLMSISRSYEANLRTFDITRTLVQKTMEIGARS